MYLCFTGPVRLANDDLSLCLRAADCDLLLARGVIYYDYCPAGVRCTTANCKSRCKCVVTIEFAVHHQQHSSTIRIDDIQITTHRLLKKMALEDECSWSLMAIRLPNLM